MGDDVKGYVVRGKNRQGNPMICATEDGVGVRQVPNGVDPVFSSLDVANKARGAMVRRGWSFDVSIFRVHADGREERLPSYEEALAMLGADPLAALEAAERRLLEAGGWTPGDRGFWIDPDDGTQWPREGAISDVRRRLAAKGGAT